MALLSVDEELERSRKLVPFSNGYEYDCWSSIWCQECIHEKACPLLLVILHERTPASWEDREPLALNRYTCTEFRNTNETPTEEMTCISSTE